jgi:VIT1/CCC1 family predicted Fe2+/Mn2+ transporter
MLLRTFIHRHLDVPSRLEEVLFGLIMVMTVTLTAGITVSEGPDGVRQLLVAAIGCNVAWGIVDGLMYVMSTYTARSRDLMLAGQIRTATSPAEGVAIAREAIETRLEGLGRSETRERLAEDVASAARQLPPGRARVEWEDVAGGIACFWLVFVTCLPAAIPFLLFSDPHVALRVSNALLIAMLFVGGQVWARYVGAPRFVAGALAVGFGLFLVIVAILLGG